MPPLFSSSWYWNFYTFLFADQFMFCNIRFKSGLGLDLSKTWICFDLYHSTAAFGFICWRATFCIWPESLSLLKKIIPEAICWFFFHTYGTKSSILVSSDQSTPYYIFEWVVTWQIVKTFKGYEYFCKAYKLSALLLYSCKQPILVHV